MKSVIRSLIVMFSLSCIIVLFAFSSGYSAEIDDAAVFVEAFNAYQQKDYLLTVEKCDLLNQVFPDSPLRDVTLLLIARASLKSGDHERAAKVTSLFSSEFPESGLKTSVEDELKVLASRHQKGEVLPADKTLQTAARKVRSDRLARERTAALKLEQERVAKAKAEQERIARIKQEEERREKDRLLAEKLAKASIKAVIALHADSAPVPVGSHGNLPFEISNEGKNGEALLLSVSADKEYSATLTNRSNPAENVTRLQLAPGETFKGIASFRMPLEMVDGHRSPLTVRAVSARFSDVSFQKDAVVVTSAPLVRAVAKLARPKVTPGEKLRYRVTLLNAGSLPAKDLTVRLQLPPEIDFQSAPDVLFQQETDGILVFKVDTVETGKLVEINLDVKIREDSTVVKQLRGQIEVIIGNLQRKDIFTGTASVVQAK